MATFDLYGTATVTIYYSGPETYIPQIRNVETEYFYDDVIGVSAEFLLGYWRPGYVTYYGAFYSKSDGSLGGTLSGFDIGTDDGYFDIYLEDINVPVSSLAEAGTSVEASKQFEASLLTGDDTLIGSIDGGSVGARLMGGNDYLELWSGLQNDVNTNWGNDRIQLWGGGGMVRAGKDNDVIDVVGGQWQPVNGNKGDDVITNYSEFAGTIRGGKDNDLLVNAEGGGYFYGDLGADTFKPYANGLMTVKDFQIGVDALDLSALGSYNIVYSEGDTLIGSVFTGQLSLVLEGVIL